MQLDAGRNGGHALAAERQRGRMEVWPHAHGLVDRARGGVRAWWRASAAGCKHGGLRGRAQTWPSASLAGYKRFRRVLHSKAPLLEHNINGRTHALLAERVVPRSGVD